jgi:hypothetical protein
VLIERSVADIYLDQFANDVSRALLKGNVLQANRERLSQMLQALHIAPWLGHA